MDASFIDNRVLFNNAGMNRVTLFRSMETDFGIIPPPKFDEQQENYYSSITTQSATAFIIPITITDDDIGTVGAIIDQLASKSRQTLLPAYYTTNIQIQLLRDEDSGEMMDLIFANRVFDLGLIHNFGGVAGIFNTAMRNNNPNIASQIEAASALVQNAIDTLVNRYIENALR
jgi:hypothetical protein